jgi:hypothetical protein
MNRRETTMRAARHGPRPRRWLAALAIPPVTAAVLICAGCAGPASSAGAGATSTPGRGPAAPTLGRPAGVFAHGTGFGEVRPARIFNGGDPTGLVTHVVWTSWGGPRAVGTGTSDYVGPGQSVATGSQQRASVVAFSLGTCHGKLMYRAVEWYFPQHGQSFSASHYQDICHGSYVPAG